MATVARFKVPDRSGGTSDYAVSFARSLGVARLVEKLPGRVGTSESEYVLLVGRNGLDPGRSYVVHASDGTTEEVREAHRRDRCAVETSAEVVMDATLACGWSHEHAARSMATVLSGLRADLVEPVRLLLRVATGAPSSWLSVAHDALDRQRALECLRRAAELSAPGLHSFGDVGEACKDIAAIEMLRQPARRGLAPPAGSMYMSMDTIYMFDPKRAAACYQMAGEMRRFDPRELGVHVGVIMSATDASGILGGVLHRIGGVERASPEGIVTDISRGGGVVREAMFQESLLRPEGLDAAAKALCMHVMAASPPERESSIRDAFQKHLSFGDLGMCVDYSQIDVPRSVSRPDMAEPDPLRPMH